MSSSEPQAGTVIAGKYRVLGPLGAGGMGTVYEALHLSIGRRVAIKVLNPELARRPEFARRFELEARAAALINHPGIVEVLDSGRTEDDVPYFVMEHLEGVTARALQRRLTQLSAGQACALVAPVLEALAATHAAGVVHRDLKPANLFLSVRPRRAVKILDFGISKFAQTAEGMTRTGTSIGTPAFMAPEQLSDSRTAGPASDLYSLGATLYSLLTGRPPFDAESDFALVARVLTQPHQPLAQLRPDLPDGFAALVDQLLAKDPAQRPTSAEALRVQLLALAAPEPEGLFEAASELTPPSRDEADELPPPQEPDQARTRTAAATPLAKERERASPIPFTAPKLEHSSRGRQVGIALGLVGLSAVGALVAVAAVGGAPELAAVPARAEQPVDTLSEAYHRRHERVPLAEAPTPSNALMAFVGDQAAGRPGALADGGVAPPETLSSLSETPDARLKRFAPVMERARALHADGGTEAALALLDAELSAAQRGPDRVAEGYAIRNRGNLAADLARCPEAAELFLRAEKLFEGINDAAGVGLLANDLGYLGYTCPEIDRETWFQIAIKARWKAHDLHGVRKSANNLAAGRWELGDFEGADSAYNEAMIAATQLKDEPAMVKQRANLALLWFTVAAGGGHLDEDPANQPVDRTSAAWKKARGHLSKAVELGARIDQPLAQVCGYWGRFERLCPQLLK